MLDAAAQEKKREVDAEMSWSDNVSVEKVPKLLHTAHVAMGTLVSFGGVAYYWWASMSLRPSSPPLTSILHNNDNIIP